MSREATFTKEEAEAKCESFHGELTSLTSKYKIDVLHELSYSTLRYTSGTKDVEKNEWKWRHGELIRPSYKKFSKMPDHSWACLLYGAIPKENGLFRPVPCNSSYHIACELDGWKLPNDEFKAQAIKATYITVQQNGVAYAKAETDCKNMSERRTHLATPTSYKELDLIDQSLGDKDNFWLGGKRVGFWERATWVTKEPIVDNLKKWRKPDTGGNCLMYSKGDVGSERYFDWFDCDGDEDGKVSDGYVCQIDQWL